MDDTVKTQAQAQTQNQQSQQSQAGDAQGQIQTQQQPQAVGVGSLVKEHGPVAIGDLRRSGPEPEIHPELEKIGVKPVSEFPEVKPEHQKVGISPAKESVPVQTTPSGHAQLPSVEEIKSTIKTTGVNYSLRWWAEITKKVLKQLGLWTER